MTKGQELFFMCIFIIVCFIGIGRVNAQDLYWRGDFSSTSSWFNVNNWNTSWKGDGDSYLPSPTNNALLDGICSIDDGTEVFINKIGNIQYWQNGTEFVLNIPPQAVLNVSNYCNIGNALVDATVNLQGELNVINANINGFSVAGYREGQSNSWSVINIDGGSLNFGEGSGDVSMSIGGASTGIVEVVNGGMFIMHKACTLGSGLEVGSDGTLLLQDGIVTNISSFTVGRGIGTGKVMINGGGMYSMSVDSCMSLGVADGTGYLEVNGGEYVGRHAFNDERSNANRSMMNVGTAAGSTGKLVQNGGRIEVVGLALGTSGGTGTVIISNGVFNAMSNNGSWPCFKIGDGCSLTIAGGDFNIYTNSGYGYIYDGGVLEFIDGSMSVSEKSGSTLFTYSNSTIRVIGPKCDINIGWWRYNSGQPQYTTMEMILTQDEGHLSTVNSSRTDQPTALPGIMNVGFAGGACLLSTNRFTCLYAGNYFYTSLVDPADYGLDLWDVAKFDVATGGDNLDITLKAGASQGDISLPGSSYAGFAPTAYGYVNIDGLHSGTLPELTVLMTMTAGAKSLDEIVADLQSAGYTNSVVVDSSTIAMKIPADLISADEETLAWDFREFDGTVNATVSEVAFYFRPKGTLLIVK